MKRVVPGSTSKECGRRRHFKPRKRTSARISIDANGRRKYIGKRRDGGGAFRAAVSKLLTEQPVLPGMSKDVKRDRIRAVAETYRRWKATNSQEYQECVQAGARGRKRCRSGCSAFGAPPSKKIWQAKRSAVQK